MPQLIYTPFIKSISAKPYYFIKIIFFRVLGYISRCPGSIPGTTKKVVGLERGPLSLASTTEELLDRKVVAPV
jgi:hypothetical protein